MSRGERSTPPALLRAAARVRNAHATLALLLATTCAPPVRVAPAPASTLAHSSTIALSPDERFAFVVQPDADRVSVVDLARRALVTEIALGPRPVVDAAGDYAAHVYPRGVSISPQRNRAFVACERSGELVAIDLAPRCPRAAPSGRTRRTGAAWARARRTRAC